MRSFVTGGSGFLGRELIAALKTSGREVRGLARSERSAAKVRQAGGDPVEGDLDSIEQMTRGMEGCDEVFHCAAHTEEWDSDEAFHRSNVTGTENTLAAARAAGVRRFILISSEAVLADGRPIVRADESVPIPERPLRGYPATKALAEQRVREANGSGIETVVLRPRYIWGRGDTANMLKLVDGLKTGRLAWISGGHYLISTCHVANVCEGALLAAERGRPGEIYFVTDGEPVEFRWFLSEVLKSQGLQPPTKSFPRPIASAAAVVSEALWRTLKLGGTPPATRIAIGLMGQEVTVVDAKARRELGYVGRVTIADGLKELASLPPVTAG